MLNRDFKRTAGFQFTLTSVEKQLNLLVAPLNIIYKVPTQLADYVGINRN